MAIKKTVSKTASKAAAKKTIGISISAAPKMERKWEIESALSTLKRADEIRKDTKMMNDVKKLAQDQMNVLSTFTKK